jgi:uncharacterized membrane protein
MQNLWDKIRKSVVEGVTIAAEKTEEYTKLGKAKIEILNTKRKISAKFTELGSILYDAINAIKEFESELESKEQKFEEMKNKPESEDKTDKEDTDVVNE